MTRTLLLALCASPLLLACASPVTVFIEGEGSRLRYTCGRFEPQARTAADARAIMGRSRETLGRAREGGNVALFNALVAARDASDTRRLEELIVEDECTRPK
jgi:hypothetical protein